MSATFNPQNYGLESSNMSCIYSMEISLGAEPAAHKADRDFGIQLKDMLSEYFPIDELVLVC